MECLLFQKALDASIWPDTLLVVDGRDAHGDDARRHIGQIQIKTVLSVRCFSSERGLHFILEELGHGGRFFVWCCCRVGRVCWICSSATRCGPSQPLPIVLRAQQHFAMQLLGATRTMWRAAGLIPRHPRFFASALGRATNDGIFITL